MRSKADSGTQEYLQTLQLDVVQLTGSKTQHLVLHAGPQAVGQADRQCEAASNTSSSARVELNQPK